MKRGVVSNEDVISMIRRELLPDGLDVSDVVRFLPYLDYCTKNGGSVSLNRVSDVEIFLLEFLSKKGLIRIKSNESDGVLFVAISEKMYEFINSVLWDAYVVKF